MFSAIILNLNIKLGDDCKWIKLERNKKYSNKTFEDIKHIDENGIEYWHARELQVVLDYKEWRKFEKEI